MVVEKVDVRQALEIEMATLQAETGTTLDELQVQIFRAAFYAGVLYSEKQHNEWLKRVQGA